MDHSAVTLQCDDGDTFKANGQCLKLFLEPNPRDFEEVVVLDFLRVRMIISTALHNLNSVVIPRLGFPFFKILFPNFQIQG
jgi:hypothetical protein